MFIYHFNRMIQNKVIWFLFASVVAIAFLSLPSCIGQAGAGGRDSAGTIAGEPVPRGEYDVAKAFVRNTSRADAAPAATETQVWAHVAAMRAAGEMGLGATPAEIRENILMTPAFQTGGQFDKGRYESVVGRNTGLSPAGYERLVAHGIALDKLRMAVGAGFVPSRMEVEDHVSAVTDRITFRTAMISNLYAGAEFNVTTNDMRDYFARHKADFALDDRVDVRYAIVPTSNYLAGVTIPQADVRDDYESHIDDYTRATTNGPERVPFDEVSLVISNDLALLEAADLADRALVDFIYDLTESTNDLESFGWRSEARGYRTATTGLVSPEKAYFTGIEPAAVEEFRDAALDLDAGRPDSRYRTARGKKYVYLLQGMTNDPAHVPSFESLVETIRPLAAEEARERAFDEFAGAVRSAVVAAMTNATFEAAALAQGLNVSTSTTFSAESLAPGAFRHSRAIVPAVQRLSAGEVSGVIPVYRGALIACVSAREESPAIATETSRGQIQTALSGMAGADAFSDWLVWNLTSRGFAPSDTSAFDEPEAEDAEPGE